MADRESQRPLVLELSIDWSTQPLDALYGRLGSSLQVASGRGRLRLFERRNWQEQHLRQADEATREAAALLVAELDGELQLFAREPSSGAQRIVRAGWAWLRNRGLRDTFQRAANQGLASLITQAGGALSAASHAGEVRRLDYRLKIGRLLKPWDGLSADTLRSAPLLGHKRLSYEAPRQPLEAAQRTGAARALAARRAARTRPALPGLAREAAVGAARAGRPGAGAGRPRLLRRLLPAPAAEHPSVDLQEERCRPAARAAARAPGRIAGFEAPPHHRAGGGRDARGAPVAIRLTQYRPAERLRERAAALPPLLFIHGYSVSGNTFTHPSLAPSAAGYFWDQGRDVWVLDMRTSTALDSATWPWAMEQPALIDIPAALLHVHQATGQRVDVLAHCIGCVMLSMALLADARSIRRGEIELGPDTWLTANTWTGSPPSTAAHRRGGRTRWWTAWC
jgi:cholesterol oxidase